MDDHPPIPTLAEMEAHLAQGEADLAVGRTVSLESVLSELKVCVERMERAKPGLPKALKWEAK